MHHLDCNDATQSAIPGTVNGSHAATREFPHDLVAAG